jgi:hypothetical protein
MTRMLNNLGKQPNNDRLALLDCCDDVERKIFRPLLDKYPKATLGKSEFGAVQIEYYGTAWKLEAFLDIMSPDATLKFLDETLAVIDDKIALRVTAMRAAFLALHPECTDAKVEMVKVAQTSTETHYYMKVVANPAPLESITLNVIVQPMERDDDPSYECHPEKVPNSVIGQCHPRTRPIKVGG